jgi:hypothetical protein
MNTLAGVRCIPDGGKYVLGVWKISDESFAKRKATVKVKNLCCALK